MSKRVVLNIGGGNFEQGFPVILQIGAEGQPPAIEVTGKLPAAPDIPRCYDRWQASYHDLDLQTRITVRSGSRHRQLKPDCQKAAQDLEAQFNHWLCAPDFLPIRDQFLRSLMPTDEVRVVLQTDSFELQKLPWHLWNVLEEYPRAEVAVCAHNTQRLQRSPRRNKRVKILAILGNSQGINTETDRQLLEQLPDADVTFLVEPDRQKLSDQLWEQPWSILFFAGHSWSRDCTGRLFINQTESLTIDDLKYGVRQAVDRGLQLAIFNSCDGLGLARDLAELHIPQTILMREQVPDRVAQEFLKHFLTTFSRGENLYPAVRSARERLQGLEDQFLCATWLPVIYQNLAEPPPTWADLKRPKSSWVAPLVGSLLVTAVVLGVRQVGLLQPWELKVYDQMLHVRSLIQPEPPDNRILVVEITDQDIEAQRERKEAMGDKSLSDESLVKLLKILNKYQPRAIGLDLQRDAKGVPAEVVQVLNQTTNLIGACKLPSRELDPTGIAPPQGIPGDRLGFADAPKDPDGVIRRHLLQALPEPGSLCTPANSLSLQLALRYLQAEGIQPKVTPENDLQLGSTILKSLTVPHGAYRTGSDLEVGKQILLNYRSLTVRPVSLTDVLKDQQPLAIKDRIVLIGVTHSKTPDKHLTPFSPEEVPGVFFLSQQVSQILSAVLDGRSLIWVWSEWVEGIWIGGWALVGGVLMGRSRSLLFRGVGWIAASLTLWVTCVGIATQGGWVPAVPPWIALTLTSGVVMIVQLYIQQQPTK